MDYLALTVVFEVQFVGKTAISSNLYNKISKAIKKKVLDSQALPHLPERLRINPFFCVQKKKKDPHPKKNLFR